MPKLSPLRSQKAALLIAVLAAIVGIAAWLLLSRNQEPAVTELSRQASDAAGSKAQEGASLVPVDAASGAAPRTDLARTPESPMKYTEVPSEPGVESGGTLIRVLSGRFMEYEDSLPHELAIDGSTKVGIYVGGRGCYFEVAVEGGRFELELKRKNGVWTTSASPDDFGSDPQEITFGVGPPESTSEGEFTLLDLATNEVIQRGDPMQFGDLNAIVPVRKAASLELEVLDEYTGAHLEHVEVHASGGKHLTTLDRTAQGVYRLTSGTSSPVLLKPAWFLDSNTKAELLIGAEGYAPSKIAVDFTIRSRRRVELERAGSLRVTLNGDIHPEAKVRLRRRGFTVSERSPTSPDLLYDDLAAGEYTVSAEFGDSHDSPVVLASRLTHIQAGAERELTLDMKALEPVPLASAEGELYVPEEWAIQSPGFYVLLLSTSKAGSSGGHRVGRDDLSPIPGMPGRYAFTLTDLEIGEYSMTFNELNFAEKFEVPPNGIANLFFKIPPPVEITVAIINAETGSDVPEIEQVIWTPRVPLGIMVWNSQVVVRHPETHEFHMRVPACETSLSVRGDYSHDPLSFIPVNGERVLVEVWSRPSAFVELWHGEERIPWPTDEYPKVTKADGEVIGTSHGHGGGEVWFGTQEPGLYRLKIPLIAGFHPHPPVEVTMESGRRKTLTVQLAPE